MSCYHPLLALDLGIKEDGKHKIKILPRRADMNLKGLRDRYGDSLMLLPCGKCIGCIKDYKSSWAVRIMLEASLYKKNCFITLTYDDKHLPEDNKPSKREISLFFKKLRKELDCKIRYFYAGELGEKKGLRQEGNPHYHAIIFGYDFTDKYPFGLTSKGSQIYRSPLLEKCWDKGLSSVGEVEPGSACYVAQYADKKKLSGEDDGSFIGMSRRPGLGCLSFERKWFKSDTIYCALGEATIPRFYHKLLEGLDPVFYNAWKASRVARCRQRVGDQYIHGMYEEESYLYNEHIKLNQYLRKMRCYL